MQEFMRKFTQLDGLKVKVLLEHCLFDKQLFYCDKLQTINDNERVGVNLMGREIFLYKQDIKIVEAQSDIYMISDGRMGIIVNKL